MDDENRFLEIKKLSKAFGDVQALDSVSFDIRLGEIRGLIGENGSGKSTVSSIIYGIYPPLSGEMVLLGKSYCPQSPLDARKNHISMIVQEKDTIDMLSVAENIFLGNENNFKHGVFIDSDGMNREAKRALEKVGLESIDVTKPIFLFNFETRKLVEIAKALYYNPMLIIIDETTTALSQDGRNKIYEIMRSMQRENKAVLFISHDLPELMELCNTLTVLRDGKLITTIAEKDFDENSIKAAMVGRNISSHLYRTDMTNRLSDKTAVRLDKVSTGILKNVSLSLHEGEILGIGGLSGSGMHETGRVAAGLEHPVSGSVTAYNRKITTVRHAMETGIGYISKDRDNETLILNETIQDNICISAWNHLKKMNFLILPSNEKSFSNQYIHDLRIKCSSGKQLVRELSGGNKQKISFAKLIGNKSRILILDSPTRGVDIGVKTTMYELIGKLKNEGCAIMIVSEELPELIGMCDRILILKNGNISGEFYRNRDLKDTNIINYMI